MGLAFHQMKTNLLIPFWTAQWDFANESVINGILHQYGSLSVSYTYDKGIKRAIFRATRHVDTKVNICGEFKSETTTCVIRKESHDSVTNDHRHDMMIGI